MMFWVLVIALFAGSACAKPSRIVGGEPTTIENYPSMVQVEYQYALTGTWSHNCAGNILTARTVLSAAHCFSGPSFAPHLRRIRAGTTNLESGGQVHYVLIAFNHPTYDRDSISQNRHDGDITVVRLIDPLVYSPVVARTAIPPQGTLIPDDLPVVYAGWGVTGANQLSPVLRDVTVFTVNHDLCADNYFANPRGPVNVTKDMICAGILGVGGKDACTADSGGPLYYGNITIGIIAFGEPCARADYPSVSTAVGSYTNWIAANTV